MVEMRTAVGRFLLQALTHTLPLPFISMSVPELEPHLTLTLVLISRVEGGTVRLSSSSNTPCS